MTLYLFGKLYVTPTILAHTLFVSLHMMGAFRVITSGKSRPVRGGFAVAYKYKLAGVRFRLKTSQAWSSHDTRKQSLREDKPTVALLDVAP